MKQEIVECIIELLGRNAKVAIPGLGSFHAEETPSQWLFNQRQITPPSTTVTFVRDGGISDPLLVTWLAAKKGVSEGTALGEVTKFAYLIRKEWEKGDVELEGFGVFTNNSRGELDFHVNAGAVTLHTLYGLTPVTLPEPVTFADAQTTRPVAESDNPKATEEVTAKKEEAPVAPEPSKSVTYRGRSAAAQVVYGLLIGTLVGLALLAALYFSGVLAKL